MKRAATLPALLLLAACLHFGVPTAEAQRFRRPVACDGCIANWYYFDEGADAAVQDWACMGSSYNGHMGSDFSLRGNLGAIDAGHDVVAMADGDVVSSQDGFFDRCTACGGSGCGTPFGFGYGNHVIINHGTRKTIYAHMRNGSIRVGMGDRVRCGDVIGQIASSGCSTGAHLHVETRTIGGDSTTAYDPFEGACSPTAPSVWETQGPHRGMPGAACDGMPPPPTCPSGTYEIWTCNAERTNRRRCIAGVDETESCPGGCLSMPVGTDDVCAATPDADAGVDAGPAPQPDAGPGIDAGPGVDGGPATITDTGSPPTDGGGSTGPDGSGRLRGGCGCHVPGGLSSRRPGRSPFRRPSPWLPLAAAAMWTFLSRPRAGRRTNDDG